MSDDQRTLHLRMVVIVAPIAERMAREPVWRAANIRTATAAERGDVV